MFKTKHEPTLQERHAAGSDIAKTAVEQFTVVVRDLRAAVAVHQDVIDEAEDRIEALRELQESAQEAAAVASTRARKLSDLLAV